MKTADRVIARGCIFSTFFTGCYTSTLIDPRGEEKEQMYSYRIESVLMRDSTNYRFDYSPVILNETIIGKVHGKQVSIPHSILRIPKEKMRSADTWRVILDDSFAEIVIGRQGSIPLSRRKVKKQGRPAPPGQH